MLPLFLAVLPQVPAETAPAATAAEPCRVEVLASPAPPHAAQRADALARKVDIRARVEPDGAVSAVEFPRDTPPATQQHVRSIVLGSWRFQPPACGGGAWVPLQIEIAP